MIKSCAIKKNTSLGINFFLLQHLCQNMGWTCCEQKLLWISETISVHKIFSQVLSLEFSCIELACNSMNNLLSYCGLVDAKIRASDLYTKKTGKGCSKLGYLQELRGLWMKFGFLAQVVPLRYGCISNAHIGLRHKKIAAKSILNTITSQKSFVSLLKVR